MLAASQFWPLVILKISSVLNDFKYINNGEYVWNVVSVFFLDVTPIFLFDDTSFWDWDMYGYVIITKKMPKGQKSRMLKLSKSSRYEGGFLI